MRHSLHDLDKLLDSRVRLALMAMLVGGGDWIDFTTFRDELELSDGNLASHLRHLEKATYVEMEKSFVNRKTQTSYRATQLGRKQFASHVEALGRMLNGNS